MIQYTGNGEFHFTDLKNPQVRIALLMLGITEREIGQAYQTMRGWMIL